MVQTVLDRSCKGRHSLFRGIFNEFRFHTCLRRNYYARWGSAWCFVGAERNCLNCGFDRCLLFFGTIIFCFFIFGDIPWVVMMSPWIFLTRVWISGVAFNIATSYELKNSSVPPMKKGHLPSQYRPPIYIPYLPPNFLRKLSFRRNSTCRIGPDVSKRALPTSKK
jgi:hypothetical protein